jgi:hypothetical protein
MIIIGGRALFNICLFEQKGLDKSSRRQQQYSIDIKTTPLCTFCRFYHKLNYFYDFAKSKV